MGLRTYTDLLRIRDVRRILVLGLMVRIPLFGAFVVLVLHVVDHLGRSYGMAGILDMASAAALAISGPWRGRLLDRLGLRPVLGPVLIVYAGCWLVAPWVGYWFLLALVVVAGLFTPPVFSIVRQVIIAAVPDEKRTAALSLDGIFTEISFMVGPRAGRPAGDRARHPDCPRGLPGPRSPRGPGDLGGQSPTGPGERRQRAGQGRQWNSLGRPLGHRHPRDLPDRIARADR
jgi:predicted MFS family arabinose efflux permease